MCPLPLAESLGPVGPAVSPVNDSATGPASPDGAAEGSPEPLAHDHDPLPPTERAGASDPGGGGGLDGSEPLPPVSERPPRSQTSPKSERSPQSERPPRSERSPKIEGGRPRRSLNDELEAQAAQLRRMGLSWSTDGEGDSGRASDAPSGDLPPERPSDVSGDLASGEAFDTTWVASDSPGPNAGRRPKASQPGRPEAHADPLIGLVVADRYRLVEQIGRGAMGIVYRCEHTRIGKLLAMKLLAGELSTNKEVVRRFKHEALTVSKLGSPHTVQVFDYGVWQHLTFLVMELVEGHNLGRVLRRGGPMSLERMGKLMVQVCASLSEAHSKGIVHRDVKPENIMILVDENGVEMAKVLDFGLAKLREGSELNEMTLQGAVIGTPYYISPEQVLGEGVDGRSDIYSLGAVMFRALTGGYPFSSTTPMGMFTKHLTEAPPSASERAPELGIPQGVSDLVRRCMAKKAADRPQTVEEVRDALLQELQALGLPSRERLFLSEPPPVAAPAKAAAPTGRAGRRRARRAERLAGSQIATRDEVEAYQRKLRRAKWGTRVLLGAVGVAATAGAVVLAVRFAVHPREDFTGKETEPNDSAAQSNRLPLGRTVQGFVGERLNADTGDRDFYSLEVPRAQNGPTIRLSVTSLPNMALTTLLYREGFEHPVARFRTGSAGQDLLVPVLRVEPGRYFLAVMQDIDGREGDPRTYLYQNDSDPYFLTVSLVEAADDDEIEPNDEPQSAQHLHVPQTIHGTIGWLGDTDVFCVADPSDEPIRWRVDDDARPVGTVLEATPLVEGEPAPLVRVHVRSALLPDKARLPADVQGAWTSPPFAPERGPRCLQLRLTQDPWIDRVGSEPPRPDSARYSVTLLR